MRAFAGTDPPWAGRSATGSSMMAWEPPTGDGQPTEWASVDSIVAVAEVPMAGSPPIACAATPVNRAWVDSWDRGMFHAGPAWLSRRRPNFTTFAIPG